MTDLISSLADSILALVNSKPQTPTKDEVEILCRSLVEMHLRPDANTPCEVDHKGVPSGQHRWHPCRNPEETTEPFDRCLCGAILTSDDLIKC
jgi:hypothetical protein